MNNRKKPARSSKAKFQMDLAMVEAKIDNKAPKLNPEDYLKSRLLLADSARLKVLDRENLELIQRLNIVNRLGGKVDCSVPRGKLYKSRLLSEAEGRNQVIEKENKKLLKEILSAEATLSTAEYLRDWKRIEENMEHTAKYPLFWKDPKYHGTNSSGGLIPNDLAVKPGIKISLEKRPRCFFDVELLKSKENLGRIVFELYEDFAPASCANFMAFCEGTKEGGLSYKGTPFHRIVPKYWCQGGDVIKFDGTGGEASIHDDKVEEENFTLRHSGPGVISTWNNGPEINNSKFNISFNSLPTMDGKKIVFGRIIRGLSNLYKIEEMGCSSGKPIKKVIISKCGILATKESLY